MGRSGSTHGRAGKTHLDFPDFDALPFDCYGTLIEWESGILTGLREVLAPRGVAAAEDALLERFAGFEAVAEGGEYLRYREVLARALRGVCVTYGIEATGDEVARFSQSVGDRPAFEDVGVALVRFAGRFKLGVITNCDDDLFARSNQRLGMSFDWIVTAQQVGSYKPSLRNFEVAFATIAAPRARILHVAQSLFHDHVPAKRLGMSSVWIDRRHDRPGFGATPPAAVVPDLTFPDMASFADAALA